MHLLAATNPDPKSFGFFVVAGILIGAFFLVLGIPGVMFLRSYLMKDWRKHARWMTDSSIFWSRWSLETLAGAPYPELAAEAARCSALVGYLDQQRSAVWDKRSAVIDWRVEYLTAQLNSYNALLASVQHAMHRASYRP